MLILISEKNKVNIRLNQLLNLSGCKIKTLRNSIKAFTIYHPFKKEMPASFFYYTGWLLPDYWPRHTLKTWDLKCRRSTQ